LRVCSRRMLGTIIRGHGWVRANREISKSSVGIDCNLMMGDLVDY